MDELDNLPVKLKTQALTTTAEKRGNLVGRGLAAVHSMKKQQLSLTDEGDAERLFRQGMRHRYGDDGTQVDDDQACEYFTKAAELNHAEAQFELAFLVGEHGAQFEADQWLERSAYLGFGPALFSLVMYEDLSKKKHDVLFSKARKWYEIRAIAGDAERQFEFAVMLLSDSARRTYRKESHYWLKASAAQDYGPACHRLGNEYLRTTITEHTTAQGIYWLSRAVDLGDIPACRTLGDFYLLGHTGGKYSARQGRLPPSRITPDKKAAITLYERSIAMGDHSTACNLGTLYLVGEHIEQDLQLAEKWLLHAAMKGYPSAQMTLGMEYASGLRLQQNTDAAIHWLLAAAS